MGGKLNGNGTVWINQGPEQQRCIYVQDKILGLPSPDIIRGEFEDGFIFGTAEVRWSDLKYSLNTYVSYGAVHGMFKIHDEKQDRWMKSEIVMRVAVGKGNQVTVATC